MKEKLTPGEIENILEVVEDLLPCAYPNKLRESIRLKICDPLRRELQQVMIYKTPTTLAQLKKMIHKQVVQSVISPGEAVGVIAAQSIGERQTQMSFSGDTLIQFEHGVESIADFVERILINTPITNICFHKNRGIEGLIVENDFFVTSLSRHGLVRRSKVTGVSMHPTNGDMLKISLNDDITVETTRSHGMLIQSNGSIIPIEASKLTLHNYLPTLNNDELYWRKICKIVRISSPDVVYDISVEEDETFMLSNGLFVHNTLNSFHSAGLITKMVVTGVPRFLELLNATKEPKSASCFFTLKEKQIQSPKQIRAIINNSLVCLYMHNLTDNIEVWTERKEEHWFAAFEVVYGQRFRNFHHGVTIHLNRHKICYYKIPLHVIKMKIENAYSDIACVFSPYREFQIDIFVDTTNISLPGESTIPSFLTRENFTRVFLEDVVKPRILEMHVCGIANITDFYIQPPQNGVWQIETAGSNLMSILGHPEIDVTKAISNNMWEIYKCFGIEATREFLIQEFTNIVSNDGSFINTCHVTLIVDIMTHHGTIHSISRYGIKKEKTGVLSRASFEESLDQFLNAGFNSEKDTLRGVSAAIMVGKRSGIGTGVCDVLMDISRLSK